MPYLHVEDFKSGLDTRKSAYTAPPGSLRNLNNGHITRGGEIEKRKIFATFASLPSDTFGLHAVGEELYTFGSVSAPAGLPVNVTYQRLQHSDGSTAMSAILSVDNFNGKIYAVAEFTDGSVFHYYDGSRVTDWDTISESIADYGAVVQALADKISAAGFGTTVDTVAQTVTVTAPVAGTAFSYSSSASNGGAVNDQQLTSTETVSNVAGVSEELAEGSFRVVGGTSNPGTNKIDSVTVDGIEILGASVDWSTSNSDTAAAIAAQINAFSSSVEYTASADGDRVVITALAGTGSTPNGKVVSVSIAGDVSVGSIEDMAGGVDEVTAVAQVVAFTATGTFETGDQFKITLDGEEHIVRGGAAGTARAIMTLGDKVYAVTSSAVYFSGFQGTPPLPDPTAWDGATGSGFINISTQTGGASNSLRGLGVYQEYLAIFGPLMTQIWSVDPDPDLNQYIQVLPNIGTDAPETIVSFGDLDVFFLSSSGVRSLRARDSSNLAATQDVGTPIDGELTDLLVSLADEVRQNAVGAVDPLTGRYWLAVDTTIYVFSHFAGSDIAAWATYEIDGVETITDLVPTGSRIYARAGDTVYLYGNTSLAEYDDSEVEVEFPFLDFGLPATEKTLHGIDVGCEGTWDVYLRPDPNEPLIEEPLGQLSGSTFGLQGRYPIERQSTHFSLRFVSSGNGYARIGNVILHYTSSKAD